LTSLDLGFNEIRVSEYSVPPILLVIGILYVILWTEIVIAVNHNLDMIVCTLVLHHNFIFIIWTG
jgi:hypothetical protein